MAAAQPDTFGVEGPIPIQLVPELVKDIMGQRVPKRHGIKNLYTELCADSDATRTKRLAVVAAVARTINEGQFAHSLRGEFQQAGKGLNYIGTVLAQYKTIDEDAKLQYTALKDEFDRLNPPSDAEKEAYAKGLIEVGIKFDKVTRMRALFALLCVKRSKRDVNHTKAIYTNFNQMKEKMEKAKRVLTGLNSPQAAELRRDADVYLQKPNPVENFVLHEKADFVKNTEPTVENLLKKRTQHDVNEYARVNRVFFKDEKEFNNLPNGAQQRQRQLRQKRNANAQTIVGIDRTEIPSAKFDINQQVALRF